VGIWTVERRIREAKASGHVFLISHRRDRDRDLLAKKRNELNEVVARIDVGWTVKAACAKVGITPPTYYHRLDWLNHRVVSVEEAGISDVTCLRVPVFHNFAVSAGIFIHNCAGAYFNAINSEERTTLLTHSVPSVYSVGSLEQKPTLAAELMSPMMPSKTQRTVKEHTLG